MKNKARNIYTILLPMKRPFQWRIFLILLVSYFLGNLAGLPLSWATNAPVEPIWFWGVATSIFALILGLSMLLANRTGLGAPFLEGQIPKEDLSAWMRSGLALTVLITLLGLPFSLLLNLNVEADGYPSGYQLVLASVKAGIVEELGNRFFLVTLFVWLGKRLLRIQDGRPPRGVYWGAIILAAILFGWAHVDARLGIPGAPFWALSTIMLLSTFLGVCFGWLYWSLGIEWAIIAHFAYDALVSAVLLKIYLMQNLLLWLVFIGVSIIAAWAAWQSLRQNNIWNHRPC